MNKSLLIILLSILLMSYECENDLKESLASQDVVFMKVYENHAWGNTLEGWIIDNAGNVKVFSNRKISDFEWNPVKENEYISEEKIYTNSIQVYKTILKVSLADLNKYYSLIEPSSKAILSEKENAACDMGITNYFALKYYPDSRNYKAIIIDSKGDWKVENTSSEAQKIKNWLLDIDREIILLSSN